MAEKISVIVPAYNAGKQLERCVNSIEAQTYPDVEVIIVDDGSKDNTGDVIRALQEKYGNIVTVNTGDRDICVTRNAGLSLVTGKYFAFVDADDYVRPELLEVLHAVLQETPSATLLYDYLEKVEPELVVHEAADYYSMRVMLRAGTVDAVCVPRTVALTWQETRTRILPFEIGKIPYYAIAKKDSVLLELCNEMFYDWQRDGTFSQWGAHYGVEWGTNG